MFHRDRYPVSDASGFTGYADELHTPLGEAELADLLRRASSSAIAVTVVGAATGLTGGCAPDGGWSISLSRFQEMEIGDGYARVGAGVLLRDLQSAAARSRQFYGPDPTEHSASIGGSIAANASGSRSFLYRDTRRQVLGLRVLLMDGTALDLHRSEPVPFDFAPVAQPRTTKNTAGYFLHRGMDYLDLFIGSEGTLGVVIEAALRLLPAPAELLSGVVFFGSDEDALAAVDNWRAILGLRMLEYMDAGSLDLLRPKYTSIPSAAAAALLIEQQCDSAAAADQWVDRLEAVGALIDESWFGTSGADRERFRSFRHALPEAVNETVRRRGLLKFGTDFAVPLDRNRDMLERYRRRLGEEFAGRYVVFGHIGDAHVHANILPRDGADAERAQAAILQLADDAVSLGGTVSAEHGLGKRKAHLLKRMYTPADIDAMRAVKTHLDPAWLLGRGNIFATT